MTDAAPDHLVPLVGGWAVWRWIRLRGAGFPARLVDELAMPEAARLVDSYLDATRAAAVARDAAIKDLSDLFERSDREQRKTLAKILKRARSPDLPLPEDPAVAPMLAPLREALAVVAERSAAMQAGFEADRANASRAARRMLDMDAFREAVTWQNRHALAQGLRRLVEIPVEAVDKETRKREQAVASYLQRYCVKNDTISFFGPVGCATVTDRPGMTITPGPSLLAKRTVYFEHWGIDAFAQKLADNAQILPWLKPRCSPTLRVEGNILHSPVEQRTAVVSQVAALLLACDGNRRAIEIARDLVALDNLGFNDEDDVYAFLSELVDQGLVFWTLEVPPEELYPEQYVRRQLEAIGDDDARTAALAMLDALESARVNVERAAGNPESLDRSLAAYEQTFTTITGRDPTRKHGETYGGRTLLYEDCRRDMSAEIGSDVLRRAAPALELLLTSARWYTHTIGRRFRDALRPIYEDMRAQTGSSVVDFRRFWSAIRPVVAGDGPGPSIVADVSTELHAHWRDILSLDSGASREQRDSAALAPVAAERFAAPGPGWPLARYQSPDLMIAARGLDALNRGDYTVVVGEVHTGINSVFVPVFVKEFPDRAILTRARVADIPTPCIAPVWSHERSRADMFSMAPHDYALENGRTRSWRTRDQVIAESSLVVEAIDDIIYVRTHDGSVRFDIIAFLEHHLIAASHSQFTLLRSAPHLPRVTVDHVVFSRERWTFATSDVSFAHRATPLERFVDAQRWARAMGLPRRVFIKVPNETKPMYVDLESSLFVDNMARMVRSAVSVTISEMLPSLDETWLVDAERNTYTSELRMVAVDPVPYRPEP